MLLEKFITNLDNEDYFQEWVKDINDDNIYYFWKNTYHGYKVNYENKTIENITESNNYLYKKIDSDVLKKELTYMLEDKYTKLNKLENFSELTEKWLMDTEDKSKYYYWKGNNQGYMFEVNDDGKKLPRIVDVKKIDKDYFEPSVMKEFKNYKVKRLLDKKLQEIKNENIESKKNIFGMWTEDNDGTYYYWKNENEGYIALVENNPLPEITKFEIVDNEYFEPRTLAIIKDRKIKKVLDNKIGRNK